MTAKLDLTFVDPLLHGLAVQAYNEGGTGLVGLAVSNHHALALVACNIDALKERGNFEPCLLDAFQAPRENTRCMPARQIAGLFERADREKLRQAGEPLPGHGPFVLYRGIAGNGAARRPRGLSWTSSLSVACWFASRFAIPGPAVITATAQAADVLAYTNERAEQEFLFLATRYKRVPLSVDEIRQKAAEHRNAIEQENKNRLLELKKGQEQ